MWGLMEWSNREEEEEETEESVDNKSSKGEKNQGKHEEKFNCPIHHFSVLALGMEWGTGRRRIPWYSSNKDRIA